MAFSRNLGPEFSLVNEPWIPVTRFGSNEPELVSLRTAFVEAPRFTGLAEGNPMTKAALLRFLTSMAYLVLDAWADGADGSVHLRKALESDDDGFDGNAIDDVMSSWADRLWLFHPEYPFCQDPRMAGDTSMKQPLGPAAITPYLPGDSSSRWGVNMSDAGSVKLDQVPGLLLNNWFYTPAGNSATRVSSDRGVSKRVASASGANFPNLTNIFRSGHSLFHTLGSNLLTSLQPRGDDAATPAFLRVPELTIAYESFHPLYAATLSAATSLIVETAPGQMVLGKNFLRGSTLFDGTYNDVAKRFTALPLASDPHVLYLKNPQNKDNHPRLNVSGSMVSLPRFCLDVAQRQIDQEVQHSGVFNLRNLAGRTSAARELLFVQVKQGGTGSSRTIEGVEDFLIPGGQVSAITELEDDTKADSAALRVQEALEPLLAPSKSALSYLIAAVRAAIDPNSKSIPDGISSAVRNDFYATIGLTVNTLIEDITLGQSTPERRAAQRKEWREQVLEVFDRHAGRYRFSQSSVARYWQARSSLSVNLRKRLS